MCLFCYLFVLNLSIICGQCCSMFQFPFACYYQISFVFFWWYVFCLQSDYNWFYFAGEVIKQFFFPIFVPIGVVGNLLSFLVSLIYTFIWLICCTRWDVHIRRWQILDKMCLFCSTCLCCVVCTNRVFPYEDAFCRIL